MVTEVGRCDRPLTLTTSINSSCNQWLPLAKPTPKVALASRNRSLVPRTSKCGWAIHKTVVVGSNRLPMHGSPTIQSSCGGRILTWQYLPELEAEAKREPADVNDCEEGQKRQARYILYPEKKNA